MPAYAGMIVFGMTEKDLEQLEESEKLEDTKDVPKILYNYGIRLLARGEQTAFQLTTKFNQKLLKLSLPSYPNIIEEVILKLTESNYLSEKRFVHAFVRAKISQKIGPLKIEYELAQKGLTQQTIHNYLSDCEAWQQNDWVEQAAQILTKKFPNDKPAIWPKKAKYLQSKGYTFEHIKQSLAKAGVNQEAELTEDSDYC
jgi:regulatory protein